MRTVAIIDDMLPNALLLKSYMKRINDIEALTFTDPVEALARCGEVVPDLVLLDYRMPNMDGVEFLRRFRATQRLKDVPVIMIAGEEGKEAFYQALSAGANEFLRKPVDDFELITRVQNLLESEHDRSSCEGQRAALRSRHHRSTDQAEKSPVLREARVRGRAERALFAALLPRNDRRGSIQGRND